MSCRHENPMPLTAEGRCLPCALADLDRPPVTGDARWLATWSRWDSVSEAHRQGLTAFLADLKPYPGDFAGRGIVIGAGGPAYFTQAYVGIQVLRQLGCRLPVELWYLGPVELDPTMSELVRPLGVTCVDARQVAASLPRPPRILAGWELKPFAMLHSRFEEVLYLDADNVPALDPTYLFGAADYLRHGAIFWPDWPPSDRPEWLQPDAWRSVGLEYRADRAAESGQILVNKRRAWRELSATMWLNEHSDRFYRVVYGDKDTFILAWHRLGTPYAMPARGPGWNGVALLQHDFFGRVVFQHRCADKWRYDGANLRVRKFQHQALCFQALRELRQKWHGQLWAFGDQTRVEDALARRAAGVYAYERVGIGSRRLELLPGGTIGEGAAGCESRWSLRHVGGQPRLVIGTANDITMFLAAAGDGTWQGRWERHERGPVRLVRDAA